ncbi:MAG TPA: MFS transporter [Acidimicrobiales bacterium]|nr:MFS transporter [Acidimicrobiales bacterium]
MSDEEEDEGPDSFAVAASAGEEGVVPWASVPRLRQRALGPLAAFGSPQPGGRSPGRWSVLWSVLAGLFAVNVTLTIFAVAIGRVAHGFHTSANSVTWVVTAPLLCFGVAAPALGRVGDRLGHRRVYLAGTGLSALSALGTALAPSLGLLILARALSGVVGAATGSASMALIFRAFRHEDRVKAMGWWSLVGAGGPVVGVVLGGVLIQHFGWRSLFVAQALLVVAALAWGLGVLPETERGRSGSFDWAGAAAVTVASLGLLLGLNEGPSSGWASPLVVGSFAVVPVGLGLFVRAERRASQPLLPLHLLRRPNFSFAIGNQLAANFTYMGGFILTPLLLERVYRFNTETTGLTVIARPLVFSLVAPGAGYLASRVGNRPTAVVGGVVLTGSMLAFAGVSPASGVGLVIVALGLSGLALGLSAPAVAASVANSVGNRDLGVASSAQQLVSQLGTVAGIQVLQTVQAGAAGHAHGRLLLGSFHDAYLVGAAAAVAATVCAAGLLGRKRGTSALDSPVPAGEPDALAPVR